ncbi:MAG: hypothetical protein V1702_06485 [Candidatus Woesearchaeota archaeon]
MSSINVQKIGKKLRYGGITMVALGLLGMSYAAAHFPAKPSSEIERQLTEQQSIVTDLENEVRAYWETLPVSRDYQHSDADWLELTKIFQIRPDLFGQSGRDEGMSSKVNELYSAEFNAARLQSLEQAELKKKDYSSIMLALTGCMFISMAGLLMYLAGRVKQSRYEWNQYSQATSDSKGLS